jgi:uncharacterized protein (TIGR02391 family)
VTRLDRTLLEKIAAKKKTTVQYVRERVSKRAARKGIISEAELINWARELGISTGLALKALPPQVQPQARPQPGGGAARKRAKGVNEDEGNEGSKPPTLDPILAAIPVLLVDDDLRGRCADLLRRPRNFDRAVAQATTVLEDRVRTRSGLKGRTGVRLVTDAFNPDLTKAALVVSDNKEEQEGFFNLCKGVMLWFRNRTHHHLDAELTRPEALRICAFVDLLLPIVDEATVRAVN